MKKLGSQFLVLIFAMQAAVLCAQAPEKQAPRFTLAISDYRHDWRGPGRYRVRVIITNTSKEAFHVDGCATQRGLYKLTVLYNGVPLEEQDAEARRRNEARMKHTMCMSSATSDKLPPAGTTEDYLSLGGRYDMSKPGTYEITVSRETFPDNPEKSVTVKSNTITIVVPDPETGASN